MRTTVDIPDELLRSAKERAAQRGESLSRIVQRALQAHLEGEERAGVEPFELIVAGNAGGRHPSPAEVHRLLEADDWSPPK